MQYVSLGAGVVGEIGDWVEDGVGGGGCCGGGGMPLFLIYSF